MKPALFKTPHFHQFLSVFDNLARSVDASKYPAFGADILRRAWRIQVKSLGNKTRKPLSLENKFYVYVLMDPRSPGPYTYRFGEKKFTFPYLPFYIGKGRGKRLTSHEEWARAYPDPVQGHHKGNTIRKLLRLGLAPITLQLNSDLDIECVAFAKEQLLIQSIGRLNTRSGPLTNMTEGGEGATGSIVSDEFRQKMSAISTGRVHTPEARAKMQGPKSEATRARMSEAQRGNTKGHGNRGRKQSPEHLAALSAVRRGKTQSPESVARRAEANRGKKRKIVECPHCGETGGKNGMTRWHFDNCKHKNP